jgi:cytoskeletal protein RodZ
MTTDTEKTSLSFGRYLQSVRIERGMRIEDVARETRIRRETLIHIEEEDHENLPEIVFVKGFLRAFAKAVGADEDEAVRRYISRLEVMQKIAASEVELNRSGGIFWRRFLLSIGALFCLIAVTLYGVSAWRDRQIKTTKPSGVTAESVQVGSSSQTEVSGDESGDAQQSDPLAPESSSEQSVPPAVVEPEGVPGEAAATSEMPKAPGNESEEQAPVSGYRLNIDTIEETWLRIVIDNQEPKEYNLFPGDQIELEAASGYAIRVGNSGGIRIRLNGEQVELPQKLGQVVTIMLP